MSRPVTTQPHCVIVCNNRTILCHDLQQHNCIAPWDVSVTTQPQCVRDCNITATSCHSPQQHCITVYNHSVSRSVSMFCNQHDHIQPQHATFCNNTTMINYVIVYKTTIHTYLTFVVVPMAVAIFIFECII